MFLKQDNIAYSTILPLIRLAHTKAGKGSSLSATSRPSKLRKRTNSDSTLILTDHLKQIGVALGDIARAV